MRILTAVSATILLSFFSVVTSLYASDIAKVGFVDFDRFCKEFALNDIQKSEENIKDEIKKAEDKLSELQVVVGSGGPKGQQVEIDVDQTMRLIRDLKASLKSQKNSIVLLRKDLFELAKKIGKKEGYLFISEKGQTGLLYCPDSIDITDKVIQLYKLKQGK